MQTDLDNRYLQTEQTNTLLLFKETTIPERNQIKASKVKKYNSKNLIKLN